MGSVEILARLYFALRDPDWTTVPGTLSGLRIQRERDAFLIQYRSTHRQGPVHFVWEADIRGEASGTIHFAMKGTARSTFLRARIGLCLLHPIRECAGVTCEVERPDSDSETAVFPREICPAVPLPGYHEMSAFSYQAAPGLRVRFSFDGDLFEMEDQRNWTDASYKTFSTPVKLPIPVEVKRGATITQSVRLTLEGRLPREEAESTSRQVRVAVGAAITGRLPLIGLGVASHSRPLGATEMRRLRALGLSHLRVDVDLSKPDWRQALERAAGDARKLGTALEVALSCQGHNELNELAYTVSKLGTRIKAWVLFPASENSAQFLRRVTPRAKIGGGTNANFYSLNESPPDVRFLDFVCYAIHPQTHSTDNDSLVETLEIQGETVACARRLAGGRPVVVSPVTLKPRFNPDATGPEPPPRPGELPPQVDPRQMSLFGAAWTLGSLKYLTEAGAYSVTFYETTGWRGVMELPEGSPLPTLFRSPPGAVFPLYHVLEDVSEFAGGRILSVHSRAPRSVVGLALRKAGRTRILLANFENRTQTVLIEGLWGKGSVRVLDEHTAVRAMRSPEAFHRRKGRAIRLAEFLLPRYAVARIDLDEGGRKHEV